MPRSEQDRSIGLIERHRPLLGAALRFLAGGILNTGATLVLYWILMQFMHYQLAYLASFCAGVLLSYVLNTRYVFKARHSWLKFVLFPLVYLITYSIGALVLRLAVEYFGVPASVAPLVPIVVTLPLSFLLTKFVLQLRDRPDR